MFGPIYKFSVKPPATQVVKKETTEPVAMEKRTITLPQQQPAHWENTAPQQETSWQAAAVPEDEDTLFKEIATALLLMMMQKKV